MQRGARLDKKSERMEQRDDEGPHACRPSENARTSVEATRKKFSVATGDDDHVLPLREKASVRTRP
jgi:hypothetical protein